MASAEKIGDAANHEKTWSINTKYDLANRHEIIESEGRFSQRVVDMENYVDYINNDMPATYRILAEVQIIPDKIVIQDDDVYVCNAGYAVKPLLSVNMVNVDHGENERGTRLMDNCADFLTNLGLAA